MDEATLLRLAGNFAKMTDIGERDDAKQLNDAAVALGRVSKEFGVRVTDELEDTALLEEIKELLTLSEKDTIIDAYLLPSHDGYLSSASGNTVAVNSRFLVVDARHPVATPPGDDGNTDRIRACFLLVGSPVGNGGFPPDPAVILPFYVISEVEIRSDGGEPRESQWSSCIVRSHRNELPLASSAPPRLVDDPSVCAEITSELNKAVQFLG